MKLDVELWWFCVTVCWRQHSKFKLCDFYLEVFFLDQQSSANVAELNLTHPHWADCIYIQCFLSGDKTLEISKFTSTIGKLYSQRLFLELGLEIKLSSAPLMDYSSSLVICSSLSKTISYILISSNGLLL